MRRFLRYNLVGLLGLGVKFSLLAALVELAGLGHMAATAIAVETTVLHNFTWHLRWTWRDRSNGLSARAVLARLLRFHLANGVVGMATNLVVMRLLVDGLGLHYLAANVVATALAGTANFALSGLVVFIAPSPGAAIQKNRGHSGPATGTSSCSVQRRRVPRFFCDPGPVSLSESQTPGEAEGLA